MESSVSTTDGQQVRSYKRKNILLHATLMASATYAAGFNPPGGVWRDTAGHLPGDSIMLSTHYHRYLMFFYFNAASFALSLMVAVLTLVLTTCPKEDDWRKFNWLLRLLMGTATLAFLAAYGTASCRDKFRVVVFSVIVAIVVVNAMCQSLISLLSDDDKKYKYRRKLGNLFSDFNTRKLVSSLYGVFLVMLSGLQVRLAAYCMMIWLLGLIIAYTVGSSRGRHTTNTVICCLCQGISPWPDLPPEIAGLILSHLPSHEDRLTFGFVCRNWRIATRQQRSLLPPAVPCINLGHGTYQSIASDESKVRRFAAPKDYIVGASFGGWLLYHENKGSGRSFLRAPNSPVIEVPCLYLRCRKFHDPRTTTNIVGMGTDVKMVVCSSRLVIAIFRRHKIRVPLSNHGVSRYSNLACFRPAEQLPATWSPLPSHDRYCPSDGYKDIAFYHGKIFALTSSEELFCYDGENQQPMNDRLISHVTEERPAWSNNSYLVVSSDKEKLLMVRWNGIFPDDHQPAMDLQVFVADFDDGLWSEVKDLAGQVLFLSRNSSKAFTAGSLEHCGLGFRGGNRVFVLDKEWAQSWRRPALYENHTRSYCVYDIVSGETSLVSLERAHYMESSMSGWFFPLE